ncbi:hypothetical protein O159_03120 [Leifsonia xyli subsp. cynodontis DSM 46306]|uniref:HTH luxR-type domain-containing protein n=1 Tax=Leifsonia xyli subsp. cynodontis DSM 46306 TaxID=1389489 RepID=U3P2J4_LEIXC|nr:LuxR C-terminal-related transcriptional regulator [Leifsonia xyli]AGW40535.1 hypothetical protein O159_03120 [Leifsonia xyli subsp. cynodontis DSM 46306]
MFNYELRTLVASVRSGRSAHVVGPGGVGASTLLRALASQLEAEGYAVLVITGAPYTRSIDFFPLQQALLTLPSQPSLRSFSGLIDAVSADLAATPLRAVILDGIENIDSGTLSVVQAAADRTSAPVVFSRSVTIGALVRADIHYTRYPGRRIDLRPLDFVGTAALVQDRLAHQPDTEIVSRVFAKSGGITGLSLAIVDGAVDSDLIELRGNRWTMTGQSLWSSSIDAWLETRFATLDAIAFDGLEHLALAHTSPQPKACTRVAEDTMKELEGHGLVSILTTSAGRSVALMPPALNDYFREASGYGVARLHPDASDAEGSARSPQDTDVALSVRGFHEHVNESLLAYAAAWEAAPTIGAALPYVQTLMDVPRSDRTLRTVFDNTPLCSAKTPEEAFDFTFLRAIWSTQASRRSPGFSEQFAELARLFPVWVPALGIFTRLLAEGAVSVGDDPVAAFAQTGIVGTPGEALCMATFAYVNLIEGTFAAAAEWAARVPPSDLLVVGRFQGFVEALTALVAGDENGALHRSLRALHEAQSDRDHGGILLHAYVATLSLLGLARWQEALEVVDSALAFGPSGASNSGLYRALLWIGSFINLWLGENGLASFFEAEAESLNTPDDALPGMQKGIGAVIRQLIAGDPTSAMETMRTLAERLSQQRNLFAALMTVRIGLAIWPETSSFELFGDLMMRAYGTEPRRLLALANASFTDAGKLVALAQDFGQNANTPLAILILAARGRQEHETPSELTEAIQLALTTLEADADIPVVAAQPALQDRSQRVDLLTVRETEIALLASTHSNAAIASRLGLSVRTVENHIHSALKKTGTANRQELFSVLRR